MSKKNFSLIYLISLVVLINISNINSENTTSKNIDDNKEEKNEALNLMQEFADEWEAKMMDYNMEYLYYIPIQQRDQEVYFENVTTVPTVFKGAFFLTDESTDKIEFYVRDSFDKVIYKATGHYNIFEIPINKPDKYSLIFRNNLAKNKVVITFTMNTGQNKRYHVEISCSS